MVATIGLGACGMITLVGLYYINKNRELMTRLDEVEGDVGGEIEETERRLARGYNGSRFDGEQPRWKQIDSEFEDLDIRNQRRRRFTVYDSSDRFKILETHGDKGVMVRGTGRLRTSGDIYKRTPSGYNRNSRNNTPPPNYPHRNNYLDVF